MEEDADLRRWDELIPEALERIFNKLWLNDKLYGIPTVCKSWYSVVSGPCCWQEIEIKPQDCDGIQMLNGLLQMILPRSLGKLRELSIEGHLADDESLSLIADHAQSLRTLKLSGSDITDLAMASAAARLASITYLDVSHCGYIGPVALEAIGKHCKHLVKLERNGNLNMILGSSLDDEAFAIAATMQIDDEAFAIAATMPKLKQLSITTTYTSTDGVLKILSSCPDLESLDIRGCKKVKLDEPFVKKFSQLRILGPELVDYGPGISAYVALYPYERHLFSGLDGIELVRDFDLDLDDPTWLSELLLED